MNYEKAETDTERAECVRRWLKTIAVSFRANTVAAFPATHEAINHLYEFDGHLERFRAERDDLLDGDEGDESGSLEDSIAAVASRLAAAPSHSYEDLLVHAGQVSAPANSPEQLNTIEKVLERTRAVVERRIFSTFRGATTTPSVLLDLVTPRHDAIVKSMRKMAPMFPKALSKSEDAASLGLADEWAELQALALEWARIHELIDEWRIEGVMKSRGRRPGRRDEIGRPVQPYAAVEFRYADPSAHRADTPIWMAAPLRIAYSFAAGDAGIYGFDEIDAARTSFDSWYSSESQREREFHVRRGEVRLLGEALRPSKLAAEARYRRAREAREEATSAWRRDESARRDAQNAEERQAAVDRRSLQLGV